MESYQVELWRAEAVKNWATAIHFLGFTDQRSVYFTDELIAIRAKIRALLDITDDAK